MKKHTLKRLPKKPSALLELAIKDLEAVEKDPRYVVWMTQWHRSDYTWSPAHGNKCAVCFAGSVLAKTVKVPISQDVDTDGSDPIWVNYRKQLLALNEFRTGDVRTGAALLDIKGVALPRNRCVAEYDINPKSFKRSMRKLASQFKEIGL
jgi:hypothetical protein